MWLINIAPEFIIQASQTVHINNFGVTCKRRNKNLKNTFFDPKVNNSFNTSDKALTNKKYAKTRLTKELIMKSHKALDVQIYID